jgi:hypothetical protein
MHLLRMPVTHVLPSFPQVDAFEQQLELCPVQCLLVRTIRTIVKLALFRNRKIDDALST